MFICGLLVSSDNILKNLNGKKLIHKKEKAYLVDKVLIDKVMVDEFTSYM